MYIVCMNELKFEWDNEKEKINIKKHGISFSEARSIFYDEFAIQYFDPDHSKDEDRFILLGLSFQLPIVVYFLSRVGLITARTLFDQWRVAIVLIAIVAAMITPSIDPVTILLTMAPLIVLYILSIALARVGERQFNRSMAV